MWANHNNMSAWDITERLPAGLTFSSVQDKLKNMNKQVNIAATTKHYLSIPSTYSPRTAITNPLSSTVEAASSPSPPPSPNLLPAAPVRPNNSAADRSAGKAPGVAAAATTAAAIRASKNVYRKTSVANSESPPYQLSEYEQQREDKIARNLDHLRSLGLQSSVVTTAAEVTTKTQPVVLPAVCRAILVPAPPPPPFSRQSFPVFHALPRPPVVAPPPAPLPPHALRRPSFVAPPPAPLPPHALRRPPFFAAPPPPPPQIVALRPFTRKLFLAPAPPPRAQWNFAPNSIRPGHLSLTLRNFAPSNSLPPLPRRVVLGSSPNAASRAAPRRPLPDVSVDCSISSDRDHESNVWSRSSRREHLRVGGVAAEKSGASFDEAPLGSDEDANAAADEAEAEWNRSGEQDCFALLAIRIAQESSVPTAAAAVAAAAAAAAAGRPPDGPETKETYAAQVNRLTALLAEERLQSSGSAPSAVPTKPLAATAPPHGRIDVLGQSRESRLAVPTTLKARALDDTDSDAVIRATMEEGEHLTPSQKIKCNQVLTLFTQFAEHHLSRLGSDFAAASADINVGLKG